MRSKIVGQTLIFSDDSGYTFAPGKALITEYLGERVYQGRILECSDDKYLDKSFAFLRHELKGGI